MTIYHTLAKFFAYVSSIQLQPCILKYTAYSMVSIKCPDLNSPTTPPTPKSLLKQPGLSQVSRASVHENQGNLFFQVSNHVGARHCRKPLSRRNGLNISTTTVGFTKFSASVQILSKHF